MNESISNADFHEYDAIIIGSGVGGLTLGSILSQVGNKRVLILEKHFKLGGQIHKFNRVGKSSQKKYSFDVGLHYVGEMASHDFLGKIMKFITADKVQWQKMPHIFEKFVYPGYTLEIPANPEEYKHLLINKFPSEKKAIEKYFFDVSASYYWILYIRTCLQIIPKPLLLPFKIIYKLFEKLSVSSTKSYIEKHFKSDLLKALLVSQWGDYGLTPAYSSFAIHAAVAKHFFHGAYYPVGGTEEIINNIKKIIEERKGKLLSNVEVEEVLIQDGKAIGVKTKIKQGKTFSYKNFYAENIVASCDPDAISKITPNFLDNNQSEQLEKLYSGQSCISLYIGFKESPQKLGVHGENFWIYSGLDHDESYETNIKNGNINHAFLSFPSLRDSTVKNHTAECITFVNWEFFKKWKDQPWRERDNEYLALKEEITQKFLQFIESQLPGFGSLIDYVELSTPLTMEYFVSRHKGMMYGVADNELKHSVDFLKATTNIKNFYLTGSNVLVHGIVGAMMGGVITSTLLLGKNGLGVLRVFGRVLFGLKI